MKEWTRDEFTVYLESNMTGLVYFYTPLCGTCQVASRMLQIIMELVDIEIGKMNLNYYPDLGENFAIESVPCLMFVKDGQVIEMLYAFHSVPFLLDKIKKQLK